MLWISVTVSVTFIIFSLCFLATSSVMFSCCFSLVSFSELTLSSFFDSSFSLTSDFFSSLGLSSNFSKTSLRAFTSLSISSWVISLLSNDFSARDKIRLSSFTDFSVFLLISVFLILSTRSFNSFLLTSFFTRGASPFSPIKFSFFSFFSAGFSTSWVCFIFSAFLSLEASDTCSFSSVEALTSDISLFVLFATTFSSTTLEAFVSLAFATCEPLMLIPPTTKNNEQPKRMCFPFFTIRQFFCWRPCLLNNIFSLLIFLM